MLLGMPSDEPIKVKLNDAPNIMAKDDSIS
jgi:hypothetical protein